MKTTTPTVAALVSIDHDQLAHAQGGKFNPVEYAKNAAKTAWNGYANYTNFMLPSELQVAPFGVGGAYDLGGSPIPKFRDDPFKKARQELRKR